MNNSKITLLKSHIRFLQTELNSIVDNTSGPDESILSLSKELDLLIVEYLRLLMKMDEEQVSLCKH